jgi:predicted glycosyltransferase
LICKKDETVKPPEAYEKEKDEIKRELGYKKMHNALENYIVKLANKYSVEINDEVLKKIPVTSTNAMVYRLLGFGGKITAVPLVSPNSDWYKQWLESKKVLP